MKTPRILAFGGSLRAASYNQILAKLAASGATEAGAEVTVISLRDFQLPLFNEEVEAAGFPPAAQQLKDHFAAVDGFIIACPEYNSSLTPALKNAIDWVSRSQSPDEAPLAVFKGKSAAILSASPGGYGGKRALVHLRDLLGNIGVHVLPEDISVGAVHEKLDAEGNLTDAELVQSIKDLGASLAKQLS